MTAAEAGRVAADRGWIEDNDRLENAMRTNLGRAVKRFRDVRSAGRGLYEHFDPDAEGSEQQS